MKIKSIALISLIGLISACGTGGSKTAMAPGSDAAGGSSNLPPIGVPLADGTIIKARAIYNVSVGPNGAKFSVVENPQNTDLSVTVAPSTTITWRLLTASPIPSSDRIATFGDVGATLLDDNDTLCDGNLCGTANVRVYLNTALITAAHGETVTLQCDGNDVGIGTANAFKFASMPITQGRVIAQADTLAATDLNSTCNLTADFSNVAAGSYTGKVVVEYYLSPGEPG